MVDVYHLRRIVEYLSIWGMGDGSRHLPQFLLDLQKLFMVELKLSFMFSIARASLTLIDTQREI